MVDMATHFTGACFLSSQNAAHIWTAIQNMWTLVYAVPPDHLTVYQGSSYVSHEMRSNLEADGVVLHEAAIRNPGKRGTVEWYHEPLRVAFLKLREELG